MLELGFPNISRLVEVFGWKVGLGVYALALCPCALAVGLLAAFASLMTGRGPRPLELAGGGFLVAFALAVAGLYSTAGIMGGGHH